MPSIEKEPKYDVYCTSRRQYQRFLNILFEDVSVAQLVASMSGVVLGRVVMVVGSNLARGKIFTASVPVDSSYFSVLNYCVTERNDRKSYLKQPYTQCTDLSSRLCILKTSQFSQYLQFVFMAAQWSPISQYVLYIWRTFYLIWIS